MRWVNAHQLRTKTFLDLIADHTFSDRRSLFKTLENALPVNPNDPNDDRLSFNERHLNRLVYASYEVVGSKAPRELISTFEETLAEFAAAGNRPGLQFGDSFSDLEAQPGSQMLLADLIGELRRQGVQPLLAFPEVVYSLGKFENDETKVGDGKNPKPDEMKWVEFTSLVMRDVVIVWATPKTRWLKFGYSRCLRIPLGL